MKIELMICLVMLMMGCHNTNPERGSGGNKVDQKTTLSSSAIVDSTKAILDQSFLLKQQFKANKISASDFEKRNKILINHYQVLLNSLSPADTAVIATYRLEKEKQISIDSSKRINN